MFVERERPRVRQDGAIHVHRSPDLAVVYSLNRSYVRRAVLRALADLGEAYPTMIARTAGLELSATLGALRGLGARYSRELSLEFLGLVEQAAGATLPRGGNARFYRLTPKGREVHLTLNQPTR